MDRLAALGLFILFFFDFLVTGAQEISFPHDKGEFQEIITVYVNDNRFIPGERILFRIENNLQSGQRSFISKIAYVELIDALHQSVLRLKIKLNDGIGIGDIYLPSYLKTGQYSLIAYTAWMLNYPKSFIAQLGIQIINPFNPIPASFLSDTIGITFYPEGGEYVVNETTKVAYRLSSKNPVNKLNIKVIAPDGTQINSFLHDHESGFGHFNFKPAVTGKYKVIITDIHENIYFSYLIVENNSLLGLAIKEDEYSFTVKVINRSQKPQRLRLISWHRPSYQKSFFIHNDTTLKITKSEWPRGLVHLSYEGTQINRFIKIGDFETKNNISVRTDKRQYKTRELVRLQISDFDGLNGLALSVRKVYDPAYTSTYSSGIHHQIIAGKLGSKELQDNFLVSRQLLETISFSKSVSVLPDYRGQLIEGKLIDYASSNDANLIMLTSPEQNPLIRTAKGNDIGEFLLMVPEGSPQKDLIIFTSGQKKATIRESFLEDYSFVNPDHTPDHTEIASWIGRKSIDVQIENNYSDFQMDSPANTLHANILKNKISKSYNFDDYTRFPTVSDIIVEITPELRLRERNGRTQLIMPYVANQSSSIDSVLILVDGYPVMTNEFLKLNAFQLKGVDLVSEQLKLGYAEYRGVAMFSSIGKDGLITTDLEGYSKVSILPLQGNVKYFRPTIDFIQSTIPDFRCQLLWEPEIDLSKNNTYEFYTSDLTGTFEITLQASDEAGGYVISKTTFEVIK